MHIYPVLKNGKYVFNFLLPNYPEQKVVAASHFSMQDVNPRIQTRTN